MIRGCEMDRRVGRGGEKRNNTNLDRLVVRPADDPQFVKAHAPDPLDVAKEGLKALTSFQVPNSDGVIQGSRDKPVAEGLDALNLAKVTLKHPEALLGAKVPESDGHVISSAQ